ncbi:MAG: shikimate kinase [Phocaeicola plebeius]|nr:shikimate kinase [Phocaeicola plebeius]
MTRIFLIGYMGSGKTTLGKAFARAMHLEFIDLDSYIEARFHKTVSAIFAEKGESGFREVERNLLREVGEFEDVIIAAGGGTPCFFDNITYMNQVGQTVFLDVQTDVLFRRLRVAKAKRPLLADKTDEELMGTITDALERRLPFYTQARYRFNAEELESRGQIAASVERLKELLKENHQLK